MTTQLIRCGKGYRVMHTQLTHPVCANRLEAEIKLRSVGIDDSEIKDAFAAMIANDVDAAEFGINNIFIRCYSTTQSLERTA